MATVSKSPKAALKATVARVRKNSKLMDAAEKLRGRFPHPAGIKPGDRVSTMIRRGEKMVKATGEFMYCNRNSVEYGVIKVGKTLLERSLSKFQLATPVMNSSKPKARVAKK